MKIVVNDIAASSGGALSILKSFYKYLLENDEHNEWVFLLSAKYIEETKNIRVIVLDEVKKNWYNRLKFDLIDGKKIIASLNPDIVFSLQNTITFGLKLPQVIYMHQSLPFQKDKKFSFFKSEERKSAVYQYIIGILIKKSIKKANKVIVQTEWIRDSIIKSTKIKSQKIVKIFPNTESLSKYKIEGVFNKNCFFYPAADIIYKNHECVYNANDLLINKGIKNYRVELTFNNEKTRKNIANLGEIPYESVIKRYNKSTLIFPSYIETAGLPLIEARQLGTIILASNCLFSREALQGYENAYFFDPFKPKELADLMEKVIFEDITKNSVKEESKEIKNSWEEVKHVILNAIDK